MAEQAERRPASYEYWRGELAKLRDSLNVRTAECNRLRDEVKAAMREAMNAKLALKQAQNEGDGVRVRHERALTRRDEVIATLQSELRGWKGQVTAAHEARAGYQAEVAAAQQRVADERAELVRVRAEAERATGRHGRELDGRDRVIVSVREELAEANRAVRALRDRVAAHDQAVIDLRLEAKRESDGLRGKAKKADEAVASRVRELAGRDEVIVAVRAELVDANTEIRALRDRVAAHDQHVVDLRLEAKREADGLRAAAANAEEAVVARGRELDSRDRVIVATREELAEANKQVRSLLDRVAAHEQRVLDLQTAARYDADGLRAELARADKEVVTAKARHRGELEGRDRVVDGLRSDLRESDQKVVEQRERVAERDRRIIDLEATLQDLRDNG